jgi:hypothetical protein
MSRISKSLNGDRIVYIAREGRKVVARADSLEKLDRLLQDRASVNRIPLPAKEDEVNEEGEEVAEKPKGTSGVIRPRKSKKKSD